jgi:hypothetical protein
MKSLLNPGQLPRMVATWLPDREHDVRYICTRPRVGNWE